MSPRNAVHLLGEEGPRIPSSVREKDGITSDVIKSAIKDYIVISILYCYVGLIEHGDGRLGTTLMKYDFGPSCMLLPHSVPFVETLFGKGEYSTLQGLVGLLEIAYGGVYISSGTSVWGWCAV